jgi:hypothetical protein
VARKPVGVKKKPSSPEYGQASAKQYQQQTRERLRNRAIKTWIIRLAILAALAYVGISYGPSWVSSLTQKGREAKYELEKSGQGVQRANDQRSGADFDPNE